MCHSGSKTQGQATDRTKSIHRDARPVMSMRCSNLSRWFGTPLPLNLTIKLQLLRNLDLVYEGGDPILDGSDVWRDASRHRLQYNLNTV